MLSILSLTHQEYAEKIFARLGKGRIHAIHLYEELFRHGDVLGRDAAFNNAQVLLKDILSHTDFTLPELVGEKNDGNTGKFLLRTHDKMEIESVLIPMQSGGTLCVSSQIGCRMGCNFCETGRMGLLRNLTVQEILAQVFVARHRLGFEFRNIVFMGMGEPFDNFENVMSAVKVLRDPHGFGLGRKQITISTSGCVEGIDRLTDYCGEAPNLAVSVNAPNDTIRTKLMAVNRKHDMKALHEAMQRYCDKTGREILIAYVLLRDVNDSLEYANELAKYVEGLKVKINLIPYNPQSRDRFQPPEKEVIEQFAKRLREHGLYTLLRVTKGKDIMAACGQLGNLELRKKMRLLSENPVPVNVPVPEKSKA
jgi:23S rRNA (adenine2503-C2)-methyltransferase